MPKQLNIKLGFEADTKQAQQQIAQLQKSLDGLLNSSIKQGSLTGFNSDIAKAQQSILQLKTALNNSLNADTGRLDLSKFNGQLNSSGLTLSSLSKDMSALGTDGQKAFLNLANSIVTAQKPMVESNKLLDGMWTALKNTARWQMSSSILHGLVGALQGAYGYAQDLNKSLTDIAIVTGRSTDQMAAFAEQANRSAQALSVSTTAYTDAALIYYQQGLDDEAVKARTDITMQMSNVTGESAEHVSSYMTAIWNNFAEGSENLEHYADVITALGAATASSSEEIANGMQQFAAVADTVGLSYEYAATALATVVAQTRQSESTVGNSFRTIFSRLQGLKLGETLEDGTDLNKYSKALATVGVNIKDQNGELKDMDTILDEIGAKWQTLAKDQQIALAQTVGGVRQYTNLVALFDNWDTFQENLNVANTSDGALQKQADIYAESWEAAQKRVKAAWQAIYQDLIDDKFFITILNAIEKILQGIDWFIDSIGGLKGVLSGLGVIFTSVFEKQMVGGIEKAQLQLSKVLKPSGSNATYAELEADQMVDKAIKAAIEMREKSNAGDGTNDVIIQNLEKQLVLNQKLRELRGSVTQEEYELSQALIKNTEEYAKQEEIAVKNQHDARVIANNSTLKLRDKIYENESLDIGGGQDFALNKLAEMQKQYEAYESNPFAKINDDLDRSKAIDVQIDRWEKLRKQIGWSREELREWLNDQTNFARTSEAQRKASEAGEKSTKIAEARLEYQAKMRKENANEQKILNDLVSDICAKENEELQTLGTIESHNEKIKQLKQELDGLSKDDIAEQKKLNGEIEKEEAAIKRIHDLKSQKDNVKQLIQTGKEEPDEEEDNSKLPFFLQKGFSQGVTSAFQGISKLTMGINTLKSAWDNIKDPNISGWQKFSSLMMALSMGFPMIVNGIVSLGAAFKGTTAATLMQEGAFKALNVAIMETPLGWLLLAITSVIAIVKIFDAAIYTTSERLEDSKKAVEDATTVLNDAKTAAEKAKTAYDDLKNVFDSFKDKEKNIKNLAEGTLEWREAIAEANTELLNALEATGQLDEAELVRGKGGLLTVSNQDKLLENSYNDQLQKQINSYYAKIDLSEKQRNFAIDKALSDIVSMRTEVAERAGGFNYQQTNADKVLMDYFVGVDESVKKTIEDYAQQLVDSGFAGRELTSTLISENQTALGFLNDIADNKDVLKAISDASAEISEAVAGVDTLKAQAGLSAAEAAGYDTSSMGSTTQQFFGESVSELIDKKVNERWAGIAEDIESGPGATEETKRRYNDLMEMAAKGSNGVWNWDAEKGEFWNSDSQANNTTATAEELSNYLEGWIKNVIRETEANLTLEDFDQAAENAGNKLSQNAHSIFTQNLGEESGKDFYNAQFTNKELEFMISSDIDWPSFQGNVDAAIEYIKQASQAEGHHHLLDINEEDLTHFKGGADELKKEVEQLASYIQENADSLVEFDNSLKDCEKGSQEAAYAIIRFDDAIQDVSENYDEWLEALNSNSLQRTKAAVIDLQKAYGNLLDLDGSQLSSDFVENTNNLKLMQEAVNGNIDSYNQLLDAAAIDNLKTMSIKLDLDEDNLQTVVDDFHNLINSYFPDFEELPVHASLDDADFLAELTNLINTIGFASGEAAEAFLKNMNIDATVVEDTTKTNDTKEIVGANAVPLDAEVIPGTMIGADGVSHDISASVPQWEYKPIKTKENESKENTAVALKVTNAKKTMGGNIKHQHSTHGGGGKSSGSCFIAGTQISLSNSYKNIEDIKPGDIVLSYNEKKKKNVFNKVLQTMIHFVHEKIYSLFIKDEKIKATGNHKFLVIHNNNQKWMEVSDIQIGDFVLFSDGTWHEISDINYEIKHETVYNFEVSDTHNYYVGKNQVLAHNKGGGGGGKNSAPKKQKREKPVQEKDRYHDLKEKIKDLTTETSRLEKISSRVWGKEKLKYMDQEIKKQEKQIDLTKEYIKEAKNYLAEDKKRLDEIKMGAEYVKDDNTGEWLLTNYEEVLQNIVDAQNKAVDAFNDAKGRYENGEISEDELKAQEEAFNLDKEKFEERKKILKQYEDTYNIVQEQMEKLIDDQWKLYDLKLEKVKVEVELELKVSDQSKKILEWSFKYLGNDLDAVSDKVANLSSQMNYLAQDLATAQKGISGIFANHGINFNWDENTPVDQIVKDLKSQIGGSVYSALTESEVDALMEYMNKLMEVHDAAAEKMKEVMDTFSTAVEKANEKLERQLNRFDGLKSTLTTYQDIVNLTGKNILKITSKNLEDLNKAMIQNDQNKLTSTRAIYEANKGMYEAARTELNEALASGDAQLVEELEEQLNSLEDTMNDALENYRDALKETLEDVQQAWEDALDAMEEAYEEAFGNLGSNWYQEQFDRQKELNELYLPDYKKYHELNKSMTELQKNLANTNNQIVKGKAKELLEDINDKMKSGAQVSEYEAGIIERRVALLKAEDELLAARNAKSTVRMTRDNEGGFSYTYTADEDQIDNAQQGYSDAYYELRDFQVTGANDLQSQWLQIQGEFAQRVREIEEQYKDNEAARTEALKQLQAEYQTYVNYFSDQMSVVYKWESTLRDNDLKDLQRVTGLKLDEWDTYITFWNDTLLNTVIPGYDTYDQLLNTWDKAMNTAITSVNKAHDNYRKNVEVTMDKAGMSVNGFKEQFEKDMANVQLDSDQTTGNIRTLTETTMTNFGKALAKVSGFTQDYLANFYKIRKDNEDTIISIQGIITALSGLNTSMDTANAKAQTLKTDTVSTITNALTEMANAFDNVAESARGAGTAIDNARAKEEAYGNEMVKVFYEDRINVMQRKYVPSGWTILGPAFDTGGYTGDWHSSEGRPAVLHEKELVLNKEDTKNMLDAVNVIRSMQTPINGLARNMFNYNSLNNVGSADMLEQQVHIDATFPNVSDHNEIELALNNLVNSASQYVNRK